VLGKHLGMQCHVEMTPELIRSWCEEWERERTPKPEPSVQTPAQMVERMDERVRSLNQIAEGIRRAAHPVRPVIGERILRGV